jgi:hypothetical protein
MAEAGLRNVSFTQSDAAQIPRNKPFDAAVGRYILCFLPDPVAVLRSLSQLVRLGGVLAFQEPCWGAFHRQAARLPLWSAGAALMEETFRRSGTNTQMGPALSRVFQEAGLPPPSMRTDTLYGAEQWMPDCLHSVRPRNAAQSFARGARRFRNSVRAASSGSASVKYNHATAGPRQRLGAQAGNLEIALKLRLLIADDTYGSCSSWQ